jgi:hypothetical protein
MSVATTLGKNPKKEAFQCENKKLIVTRSTKQENQHVHCPCPLC